MQVQNIGKWLPAVAPKLIVGLAAIALVSAASATVASAYNNSTNSCGKWPYAGGYAQLTLYYADAAGANAPTGDYAAALAAARTSWFNTATPAVFAYSSPSTSTHGVYALGPSILGTTMEVCSGGTILQEVVKLNSDTLDSGFYGTVFWKQSASAHEQGHHIGLGHSDVLPAIMKTAAGTDESYNGPLSDDECGVNHIYASATWPPTCGY